MTDRYAQLVNTPIGKLVTQQMGLPQPPRLERHTPGRPVIAGPVLFGGTGPPSRLATPVAKVLSAIDADVFTPMDEELRIAAAQAKLDAGIFNPEAVAEDDRFKALVLDATGIQSSDELDRAWAFLHPAIRRVLPSGRVLILGTPPEDCAGPPVAIAQRALEGLERAVGKEIRQRRDLPAHLRQAQGRGPARVDAAFLPLAAVGVRLRSGRPDRPRRGGGGQVRLGRAAGRQGRARHRRGPRDRGGHRRGPLPRRRPRGGARRGADG